MARYNRFEQGGAAGGTLQGHHGSLDIARGTWDRQAAGTRCRIIVNVTVNTTWC